MKQINSTFLSEDLGEFAERMRQNGEVLHEEIVEVTFHNLRMQHAKTPIALRLMSREWLIENGYLNKKDNDWIPITPIEVMKHMKAKELIWGPITNNMNRYDFIAVIVMNEELVKRVFTHLLDKMDGHYDKSKSNMKTLTIRTYHSGPQIKVVWNMDTLKIPRSANNLAYRIVRSVNEL